MIGILCKGLAAGLRFICACYCLGVLILLIPIWWGKRTYKPGDCLLSYLCLPFVWPAQLLEWLANRLHYEEFLVLARSQLIPQPEPSD